MEEVKKTFSVFLKIILWLIVLGFLYIGIESFSSGFLVGAILVILLLVYFQIQTVKMYYQKLKTNTSNSNFLIIYICIGILQSFLVIAICLTILSLIGYSAIYGKSKEAVLREVLQPNYIGYIFTFFGGWGLTNSAYQILGYFLKDKLSLEFVFDFKVIFIGFISVIFFVVGILLLTT